MSEGSDGTYYIFESTFRPGGGESTTYDVWTVEKSTGRILKVKAHGVELTKEELAQQMVAAEQALALKATLNSISANALHRFTPHDRDCYAEFEISLKFLPREHGYR